MKISKLLVLTLASWFAVAAHAAEPMSKPLAAKAAVAQGKSAGQPSEAELKKMIEPRLGDGVKIDTIKATPYSGLYEIRIGSDILYTDAKGDYLFMGNVFQTKNMQNLTKERTDELSKVKFADLPLDQAIKIVKGDGKRVMAIFEDPNCGYCKRFRNTLAEVDNVTVYSFMYPILGGDSPAKAKNIWCAGDSKVALEEWMTKNKEAVAAAADCKNPVEKVMELGQKLRISGTPTIIFADGSRIPGAIDAKGLERKFASIK
jgi:thiol:disulfide interchange protein DsbC